MMKWLRILAPTGLMVLGLSLAGNPSAAAQSMTAVSKLDLNRYTGVWYEIARYPDKLEKHCVDNGTVLYALGDKAKSFQMGVFCQIKGGNSDEWNATGKLDKSGDGRLKVTHTWPFHKKFWVLATGPSYEWALVGSPNRKTLWVLSRTVLMSPELLAQIEAAASVQGYDTAKLLAVSQHH